MTQATNTTVVTFYEEYGAGATYVAPRVAERLGVPYVTQRFTSDQIEAAEVHEEHEGLLDRFFRSFTPVAEPDASITWATDALPDSDTVAENTQGVLDSVRDGGVILGRSATVILAKQPGTLHVKLTGPVDERIARAAAAAGIDLEAAARRQEREDRVRVEMSKHFYRWDPDSHEYFDLVLNTGSFTLDEAVDVVVAAYRVRFP